MSPKLIKPTLGRASESCWEEHAPKLGVHIAGSHHHVKCTDVAHGISGTFIGEEMGYFEPWWERSACDTGSKGLELLVRVFNADSSPLGSFCH